MFGSIVNTIVFKLCILFTLLLVLYSVFYISGQRIDINLNKDPERLTELYITYPNSLSKDISVNKSFSFTIHNFEYRTVVYEYQVLITDSSNNVKQINGGKVTLEQNQLTIINNSLPNENVLTNSTVFIRLLNKNQQIHFKLNNLKL